MAGPVGMLTRQDANSATDLGLVHELLLKREDRAHRDQPAGRHQDRHGIRRPSDYAGDPGAHGEHVAAAGRRARVQHLQHDAAGTVREPGQDQVHGRNDRPGAVVTRTSGDTKVVAAIQGHTAEVTALAQEGMIAMRRGMMARIVRGGPN